MGRQDRSRRSGSLRQAARGERLPARPTGQDAPAPCQRRSHRHRQRLRRLPPDRGTAPRSGESAMSEDVIMVLVFMVIVVPIVLGVGADIYKRRLAFRERELELLSKQTAEKAAQYAAQAERLEQRVRVLERIATENNSDLALQIENLREVKVN